MRQTIISNNEEPKFSRQKKKKKKGSGKFFENKNGSSVWYTENYRIGIIEANKARLNLNIKP
jgi:hypothetical protein